MKDAPTSVTGICPPATTPAETAAPEAQAVPPADAAAAAADSKAAPQEASNIPSNWSVQEVYEFIRSVPGCAAYADEFRSQDIDGEALIFLKSEHMSLMNVTIGAAARICARLNQLCGRKV